MANNRVKFNLILENLVPEYVREEFPLVIEFLREYYKSIENHGQALDLLQNIDKYVKIDNITNLVDNTKLSSEITFFDDEFYVESIEGFPSANGLIQIDSEVIFYERAIRFNRIEDMNIIIPTNSDVVYPTNIIGSIEDYQGCILRIKDTNNNIIKSVKINATGSGLSLILEEIPFSSTENVEVEYLCDIIGDRFIGCKRGFSGVVSYTSINAIDKLTFNETESDNHDSGSIVKNLNILLLKEFFKKLKYQIAPGFEGLDFPEELNESTFVKNIKQFYSSKGTDCSFELLFRALFAVDVEVIKPRDYLIIPSDAQYRVFRNLMVEQVTGDPRTIVNKTLYQDEVGNIPAAKGVVSKVEKIRKYDNDYYIISLDNTKEKSYDLIFGTFSIHPKTKVTTKISQNSSYIDVDSTIGFPNSGELFIEYENGLSDIVTYGSRTSTQFLECNGISQEISILTKVYYNTVAYSTDSEGNTVSVRVTGVLSDLEFEQDSYYNQIGDKIQVKTLGKELDTIVSKNWFLNVPVSYDVASISILDDNENQRDYLVNLYDEHILKIGDPIFLVSSSGEEYEGLVFSFVNERSVYIRVKDSLNESFTYTLNKNISKVNSSNYKELNQFSCNVQNVYQDKSNYVYVNSQSLPNYLYEPLTINDNSVTFSGSYENAEEINIGPHNFFTGDSVVYKPGDGSNKLNIDKGIYFVKKVNNTTIKLARSKNNIYTSNSNVNNFLKVTGNIENNKLEFTKFNFPELTSKQLRPQNILRKLTSEEADSDKNTVSGTTGILVNGVEILNYKSKDQIFYGEIKSIIPSAEGSGYDVINPPSMIINDPIGVGASAFCSVIGSLKRIDVIDPGFDYIETPKIEITGGNGSDALANVELVNFDYSANFDIYDINSTTNTIGFTTYHRFRTGERVIYLPLNDSSVSGLSTNSSYYVKVIDDTSLRLYKSLEDMVIGISTISIEKIGGRSHKLISQIPKKRVGSITIVNGGHNYQSKLRVCSPIGINTYSDTVNIKDHGYESGEIITYHATQQSPVGLISSRNYYVTKINDNQFKLSEVGISSVGISTSFFYDTKQYLKFGTNGSGRHIFNYPKIEVTISGKVGSYSTVQDYQAKLQPIFSGKIQSVFVENGGNSYGSNEIINYLKQPEINLLVGTEAQVEPIIFDGKIVDVIIKNPGINYFSVPTLKISGAGYGAILTPIVKNGSLFEIKVISSGIGYNYDTKIDVIPSGSGAKFECLIQSWNVNLVERLFRTNTITDDDGVVYEGKSKRSNLEYTHAYSPRKLRSSVFGSRSVNGRIIYSQDLELIDGKESDSSSHSPIIGWAYDGNPIYGPYGYSSITGGSIKQMISGYELVGKDNRPSLDVYPLGFFVEDYVFFNSGDLDEHNGRYCVTPEFPNGVYAYFTTINNFVESKEGSPFNKYKKPSFPYFIGNSYKSNPIKFNFSINSNLNLFDINEEKWFRNTKPYGLTNQNSGYKFIENQKQIKYQLSTIDEIGGGSIESVGIITGGTNYKIGEKVLVDNTNTDGFGFNAEVSEINGKEVQKIESLLNLVDNIEILYNGSRFVAFSTSIVNFDNNTLVAINSKYDFNVNGVVKNLQNSLTLTNPIEPLSITGIVTYFSVSGNLNYPNIKENDIYQIGSEWVKILNVDSRSSRIRVLRNINELSSNSTILPGIIMTEIPSKFELTVNSPGLSTESLFYINRELYFDPKESIGIGTSFGIGITTELYFSNPGVGVTFLSIPTKSLYFENHNLNTGDELFYSSNGGTPISVSLNGISSFQLQENSKVYVVKISSNLIGISTVKVGINSIGNIIGISTTENRILYFTEYGSGKNHSFTTNYPNIFRGRIFDNQINVTTKTNHGLQVNDNITLSVESNEIKTFKVKYNKVHRRILVNPVNFSALDVNIDNNSITIPNHNFKNGQKIIYNSELPSQGLENNKIYFVAVLSKDSIGLSTSIYNSTKLNPEIVEINSSSLGTISPINPTIDIIKNEEVVFDLSDPSLSFTNNSFKYSAFDLKLYSDSQFNDIFENDEKNSIFNIERLGRVGIDSDAKLVIKNTKDIDKNLFYNLVPINLKINDKENKEAIFDTDVVDNNKINFKNSSLNASYRIAGITSNTFRFSLLTYSEILEYNKNNSNIFYKTSSRNVLGEINSILVLSGGINYKYLPKFTGVRSSSGNGAILRFNSNSIGSILKTKSLDISFNYSSDFTIRPTAIQPLLVEVENISIFDSIDVVYPGKNYNVPPKLIVIDTFTNKTIDDLVLEYNFNERKVNIIKNTLGISDFVPKVFPINNNNGISIRNITYNNVTKDVTVILDPGFSREGDFPFNIGDKVYIENVSVGVSTEGKGYNSINYDYSFFEITNVDKNIGGSGGSVTYNLANYLENEEFPGQFDSFNSSGIIIPAENIAIFEAKTKKREFYINEFVESNNSVGKIENVDLVNNILKISSKNNFDVGQLIKGTSSNSVARIKSVTIFNSEYTIKSYSDESKGWERQTGFLNNDNQRIHDSDYYQYFSYDLKSTVDYEKWNPYVSNLNHTSGFKKFGSLIVNSKSDYSGISTEQSKSDFVGISEIYEIINLNCYSDFDMVRENNINIESETVSNEIIFNSALLQDYIESVGNRVLLIDDISGSFNSNPRSDNFSIVDSFSLEDVYKKYFILIQDKVFPDFKQTLMVSMIQDNEFGYLNQYGRVENFSDLGYFDFRRTGSFANLLFFPKNFEFGSYDVSYISFNFSNSIVGVGQTAFGDSAEISTVQNNIVDGVSTKVIGISTAHKAAKILIQTRSFNMLPNESYYEVNEITLVHNGTDVSVIEYGGFNTSTLVESSGEGVASYDAYILNDELVLEMQTNVGTGETFVVDATVVSIGNTEVTEGGIYEFDEGIVGSGFTSTSSSSFPSILDVFTVPSDCQASYVISLVEDLTNNQSYVSEIILLKNEFNNELLETEYGLIGTNGSIGSYSTSVIGNNYKLQFTPIYSADLRISYFHLSLGRFETIFDANIIDLNNIKLDSNYGEYFGTYLDIRKEFSLTYKGSSIFEKIFDSSDPTVVNIENNSLLIPYHFFTTGEEVEYRYDNSDISTEYAISITPTNIPGIGVTDKLPTTLYIVKENDLRVKVSASASQALKTIPDVLDFSGVGIGTQQKFICKKRNEKSLIAIDNLIQSPIVSTSTTAGLTTSMNKITLFVEIDDSEGFFGGDLISIDNEVMLIRSVDFPAKNILLVDRALLGSFISMHPKDSIVTKVKGNYNIVDNKIFFTEAPFGKIPVSNPNGRIDEIDYVGLEISSRFNGRVFLRSGITNSTNDTYLNNKILDDISNNFNTINSEFAIKYNNEDITGISTDNSILLINNIFQYPETNYIFAESSGITSVFFESSSNSTYDSRIINLPKGGIILSVGSSEGFGYQPLVSAGGTAIVSSSGTIQSIVVTNSGSGYRSGIQTNISVGVVNPDSDNLQVEFIGIASAVNGQIVSIAITNPGFGYTQTNPPNVIIDSPYPYTNIPLVYRSNSSGVGTEAKVNIVVGQNSNVIDFEITNFGYGYEKNDILTVDVGGAVGIPTNSTSSNFIDFTIFVDSVFNDNFSAWTVGSLKLLDSFENRFDGVRKRFPISIDENQISIVAKKGSNIDIQSTLLVFVNDVLQVPGEGYIFNGGSIIEFTDPPKEGDKCSIVFYAGTSDVDTFNVDILETIKVGDVLTIQSDNSLFEQDSRVVEAIENVDSAKTNLYDGRGIEKQVSTLRPVTWCKQTEDKLILGNYVGKNRVYYEPYIQPTTNIIKNIGVNTDAIFVESAKGFFDSEREYAHEGFGETIQNKILIISQDTISTASAECIVSSSGTVSSIIITNSGIGYTTEPTISITNPIGIGSTAKASATIVSGAIASISIISGGFGYDENNPPQIFIESPPPKYEVISNVSYQGDYGLVVGISTTIIGINTLGLTLDLLVPKDSILRDNKNVTVGVATTGISGIQTGYYFVVKNSIVGNGVTSKDIDGNILGVGENYIDNIYQVSSVSIAQTSIPGIGLTYVTRVIVPVSSFNNLISLGSSSFYGDYSWGRIFAPFRTNTNEFECYSSTSGISTSPVVQRFNRLRYVDYSPT